MEFLIICYLFLCVFLLGCACMYALLLGSYYHSFRKQGWAIDEAFYKAKGMLQ